MNVGACEGREGGRERETDRYGSYAARMLKTSAEDALEVHS